MPYFFAHNAEIAKGGRCSELVDIANLYLMVLMDEQKKCFYVQKRAATFPWIDPLPNNDHTYLLLSTNPIPRGPLRKYSEEDSKKVFILDPFRDLFVSVYDVKNNESRYPGILDYDLNVFFEQGHGEFPCFRSEVQDVDRKYNGTLWSFFKTTKSSILKAFKIVKTVSHCLITFSVVVMIHLKKLRSNIGKMA